MGPEVDAPYVGRAGPQDGHPADRALMAMDRMPDHRLDTLWTVRITRSRLTAS